MLQKNWQDLIKPEKLVTEVGVDSGRSATIVAEPLERGFGLTLGNALRRVLLSSLQGAAVTSIKIDNVFHEFSAIPGVKEDTTELVLNVKQIRLRSSAGLLSPTGTAPSRVRIASRTLPRPARLDGAGHPPGN